MGWEPAPPQVLLHYADETNGQRRHDFVQAVSSQWSTRVSRRSRKRQRRLIAMQAALETRLYQKEKNKHRQNDPKKVGRGQRPKKKQRELRLT